MIEDTIAYMNREYRDVHRGVPNTLYITPDDYAELMEAVGISPEEDFTYYSGMEIIVDDTLEETYIDAD